MTQRTCVMSAVLLATVAAARADDAADPLLAEIGAQTYQQHCTACHGSDGQGDGPAATALKAPPSDLTRIAARRSGVFPAGEIAKAIDGRFHIPAHGSREMPVWGQHFGVCIPETEISESVTRGKIATLVEYLKGIQTSE
jgi:mono/diheme cytochrome c family protein